MNFTKLLTSCKGYQTKHSTETAEKLAHTKRTQKKPKPNTTKITKRKQKVNKIPQSMKANQHRRERNN